MRRPSNFAPHTHRSAQLLFGRIEDVSLHLQGSGNRSGGRRFGSDLPPQLAGEDDTLLNEHGPQGRFRGGQQGNLTQQRGDPVFFRRRVGVLQGWVWSQRIPCSPDRRCSPAPCRRGCVETERIQLEAALGAQKNAGIHGIEVGGPGFEEIHGGPVVEPDEAHARFLHVVAAFQPALLIHGDLLVQPTAHAGRRRKAHEIQQQGNMVHAEIVEGAAAGVLLLREIRAAVPVHKGPVAAAESHGPCVVQFSQGAAVHQALGGPGGCLVQGAQLNVQRFSRLPGGLHHGKTVGIATGQGLFTVDVRSSPQRGNGVGRVEVVVDADIHGVNVIPGQHGLHVRAEIGNVPFLGAARRRLLGPAAHRHHLRLRNFLIGGQVLGADRAGADQTNSNVLQENSSCPSGYYDIDLYT